MEKDVYNRTDGSVGRVRTSQSKEAPVLEVSLDLRLPDSNTSSSFKDKIDVPPVSGNLYRFAVQFRADNQLFILHSSIVHLPRAISIDATTKEGNADIKTRNRFSVHTTSTSTTSTTSMTATTATTSRTSMEGIGATELLKVKTSKTARPEASFHSPSSILLLVASHSFPSN